jgi:hypothetical protein
MKISLIQILLLLLLFTSCFENPDNSHVKVFETSKINVGFSKEDSSRISLGLLPLKIEWILDTTEYGLRDSITHIWNELQDTNQTNSFLTKKEWKFVNSGGIIIIKTIETDNIGIINSETDIYRKSICDSSMIVELCISYDYNNNEYTCLIDTIDLQLKIKAESELTDLHEEWNRVLTESKEDSLIPDGTWYHSSVLKIWQSYIKIKTLDIHEAKIIKEKLLSDLTDEFKYH